MTRRVVLFVVLAVLVAQAGVAMAQNAKSGAASDARSPGESDQAYAYRTYATAGAAGSLSKAIRVYKALGSKELKRSHRWLQIAAAGHDPAYFVDLQTAVTGDTPRVVVKSVQGGVDSSAMEWEFDCTNWRCASTRIPCSTRMAASSPRTPCWTRGAGSTPNPSMKPC